MQTLELHNMDIALVTVAIIFIAIWLWLTILGYIAVNFDETLDWQEQRTQKLIVLLVPIFGAVFILHVTNINTPQVVPRSWIPWPLKNIIFGKHTHEPNHQNTDEHNEIYLGSNNSINKASDSNYPHSESKSD